MKKLLVIILLLSSSLSLFAYSDGVFIINAGFEESVTREIDHSLYMMEVNNEKTWFYNDGPFGLSNDISFNLPIFYRLGKDYSKPFDTFNTALSLDYSLKGAFRFKPLSLSLGPSIRTNIFFSEEIAKITPPDRPKSQFKSPIYGVKKGHLEHHRSPSSHRFLGF